MAAEVTRALREVQLDTEGRVVPVGATKAAMAEVTRVLREVQLDTEGRVVPVGATKADRKMIGIPKAAGLASKKAGTGMVKAASWSDFGTGTKPAAGSKTASASGRDPGPKEERKAKPAVSLITKETVPQSFIDRIKAHPTPKLPPLSQGETELFKEFFPDEPEVIARELENIIRNNYLVDLEQDCLEQYEKKGYAEVGVDFTNGMKQIFILPRE